MIEWLALGLALALVGALAGVLSGLLGIGGGLVYVPALLMVLHRWGVPPETAMHLAVGSSLAAIVLTSLTSTRAHARFGHVDWAVFRALLPGLAAGAASGALLASAMSGTLLRQVFGGFLLLVALHLFMAYRPEARRDPPGAAAGALAGAGIGTVSAMLGIGGGTLTVPYLSWRNLGILNAIGTAAAAGLPLAAVGALTFVVTGQGAAGLPAWSAGYVFWPGALALGLVSMAIAPLGARLAKRTAGSVLQRSLGVVLALIAFRLIAY